MLAQKFKLTHYAKKRTLDAPAVVIYYCLNTGKEVIRKIYE
jgi:hypothetical protein